LWGSRPLSDWHAIWGVEWYPERNHPCQISCWSVKGFLGGRTPKSAISYTYWNDPYNSPALPCRLWSNMPQTANACETVQQRDQCLRVCILCILFRFKNVTLRFFEMVYQPTFESTYFIRFFFKIQKTWLFAFFELLRTFSQTLIDQQESRNFLWPRRLAI